MKKKLICIAIFTVILCIFTACSKDDSADYISAGIEKISDSNSIGVHFHSESTTESDVVAHGVLDADIFFIKEPYTWYSESLNSYYENNEEKFSITYGSYIEAVNGKFMQYEKYQSSPNEILNWKPSSKDTKGIKDQADYYRNEMDAYLFMFSSNINNFHRVSMEKINDKDAVRVEGYFTKETASECIDKYLKNSFKLFGSDFTETHPLTLIKNCSADTPVSIWFDKESGDPVFISINLTEAEQSYRDDSKAQSSSVDSKKVNNSSITIEIKPINNDNKFPIPEGIPVDK